MRADPFLCIRELTKAFAQRRWWGSERLGNPVLRHISLSLEQGRTLGLVGASGAGKSTLARCIALFERPTSGEILLAGRDLGALSRRERRGLRSMVQLIVQESSGALNPRFTAGEIIAEPLVIKGGSSRRTRENRVMELMETVGLPAAGIHRPALEWSLGERQRLAIARALAIEPSLLILDESLSGLDLSLRAQIANLLLDLQEKRGVTYILISHDLAVVTSLADEVAVIEDGIIVEHAPVDRLLSNPQHGCTRSLLSASRALGVHEAAG